MYEFNMKINEVCISIKFEKLLIEKYLNDEFLRYRGLKNIKNDLEISIINKKIIIPKEAVMININLLYNENMVYQRINAKFRETWIKYEVLNHEVTHIYVYIPTPKQIYNSTFKLISRNSLGVVENSLIDFFHGPFLGFMQLNLLKYGSTFIHASSISYKDFGIIFIGEAQSGKTTILNQILTNDKKVKFISEDLTIIDEKSNLFGYQKQASIDKIHKPLNNLLEKLKVKNKVKYRKLLVKMLDLYDESQIIDVHKLDYIYVVDRNHRITRIQEYSLTETINFAIKVMSNELQNFNGFYDVITLIDSLDYNEQPDKLNDKMRKVYDKAFKEKRIFKLNLKEYENIEKIYLDVDAIIRRIFEEES